MEATNRIFNDIIQNLAWNLTYLAEPLKNGVVFKYDPESPVLDKTGKPTNKTFGKLTTTILFSDGTKCSCSNSALDPVNPVFVSEYNGVKLDKPVITADDAAKEAGIVNCLFKRCIGNIKVDGTIDGSGGARWLRNKIAESYDQNVMEVYGKSLKKAQAAENAKKHAAAAKKAHNRKVKKLAKQLAIRKEAEALASAPKTACKKVVKPLCETKIFVKPAITKQYNQAAADFFGGASDTKSTKYVRPNKKFSDFTQEEKRAYWRAQKRGEL